MSATPTLYQVMPEDIEVEDKLWLASQIEARDDLIQGLQDTIAQQENRIAELETECEQLSKDADEASEERDAFQSDAKAKDLYESACVDALDALKLGFALLRDFESFGWLDRLAQAHDAFTDAQMALEDV